MKVLVLLTSALLAVLLVVPLGAALAVVAVAAPQPDAVAPAACVGVRPDGTAISALPAAGEPRRASRTNPPTDIPAAVQALYEQAAAAHGVPWPLLAGVGMAETNHGRLTATSSAGAQGLMQFLPATFAAYGIDGDSDGRAVITNDADLIHSAANYLAASGAGGGDGVRRALFAYNGATWYVNDVLFYAQHYASQACASELAGLPAGAVTDCPPSGSAAERGLQPSALRSLRCVKATFGWITSMGGVGPRPNVSDHPKGLAVDFMIPAWNTPDGRARGWQVAHWLQENAAALNVKFIIFDDHVWRSYRTSAGWTPYTHPNGATSNPTLRHLDHVHLSTT